MLVDVFVPLLVGLLPVATFLATLLYLDSYKLVKLRVVVAVAVLGAMMAGAGYLINGWLLGATGVELATYSRYVAPFVEEMLKALVVIALIRTHRIGFLVDAAIFGFAVGTGFATVENIYFLHLVPDAGLATWIVRGLGTAIMHGGATAIFAVLGLGFLELTPDALARALLPGYALAVALHSVFNHLLVSPRLATLGILVMLPPLLYMVFQRSEKALGDWLGQGLDADMEMLALLNSGRLSDSPVGEYLTTLKARFTGPVVADLLCYLRIYTELALRAKGILMMNESGFDIAVDEETKAKFVEMRYLESSIGKTGLLALKPMLHMNHRDLWQLYRLGG